MTNAKKTTLTELVQQPIAGKIRFSAMVISVDTAPLRIAKTITPSCCLPDNARCHRCKFSQDSDTKEFCVTPATSPDKFLGICLNSTMGATKALSHYFGVSCKFFAFNISEYYNVVRTIVQPDFRHNPREEQGGMAIELFTTASNIKAGQTYEFVGMVSRNPRDQSLVIWADECSSNEEKKLVVTASIKESLSVFSCDKSTMEGIEAKMREIITDITFNITRRYELDDYITFILLTMFSADWLDFDGDRIRGFLDMGVLGDPGTAKSETAEKIAQYTGKVYIVRGVATYAGLIGGMVKTERGNYVRSGILPANNGGMVVFDEAHDIRPEVMEGLSDSRTSGVAAVNTIYTMLQPARVRKLWIYNPPKRGQHDIFVTSELMPVKLIEKVVAKFEDRRRFDLFIGIGRKKNGIASDPTYRNFQAENRITRNVFQDVITYTWSRQPEQIVFTPEAVEACHRLSQELVAKYETDVPMVMASDQHARMARLSAAFASLVRDADNQNWNTIVVKPVDVEWVYRWIEHLFQNNELRYSEYVRHYKQRRKMFSDHREYIVRSIKAGLNKYEELLTLFSHAGTITERRLKTEYTGTSNVNAIISYFLRWGLIENARDFYVKTDNFNSLLSHEFAYLTDQDEIERDGTVNFNGGW